MDAGQRRRLLVSIGVELGCAVVVAIALTVGDLYLPIFLLAALIGAALTWRAARRA